MRKSPKNTRNTHKSDERKKKSARAIKILAALTVLSFVCMIVSLEITSRTRVGEFVPPEFDPSAEIGVPQVPDGLGYYSPYAEGMAYRFSVCGNVTLDGEFAVVYLTNHVQNSVNIKLRITDTDGNILGESGLLRPGEYVRTVKLNVKCEAESELRLKIMGYEPETYLSAGSVTVNTRIAHLID